MDLLYIFFEKLLSHWALYALRAFVFCISDSQILSIKDFLLTVSAVSAINGTAT